MIFKEHFAENWQTSFLAKTVNHVVVVRACSKIDLITFTVITVTLREGGGPDVDKKKITCYRN